MTKPFSIPVEERHMITVALHIEGAIVVTYVRCLPQVRAQILTKTTLRPPF